MIIYSSQLSGAGYLTLRPYAAPWDVCSTLCADLPVIMLRQVVQPCSLGGVPACDACAVFSSGVLVPL